MFCLWWLILFLFNLQLFVIHCSLCIPEQGFTYFCVLYTNGGRRVIGISGSLIWSKTLMELTFNPCGEFRWSPVGPVSQIHSPHLLVSAPGIFSDLLRFVQMLKRERGAESNGKLPHLFILVKLRSRFLSLQWKTCLWAELQPWCLSLQSRTCPWAEHMMMMMYTND